MNPETVSTIFNFTAVVGILVYFGRKPIRDFFQTRSTGIADSVNEARSVSTKAQNALLEWEGKLRSAKGEIVQQAEDAKASMAKFRESVLQRATKEAKRIGEEAVQMGTAETHRAKRELRRHLALESVQQAREYLNSHVDKKDTKNLLTDYLDKVANGHAR